MSKKEQIKKQQAEFLETMKAIKEEKDIDAIAELFLSVIAIYGLKMDETASLLYFIQRQTVEAEHNAEFLKERMELDVAELGVDGVLQVQQALISTYASRVRKEGIKHG